MPVGGTYTTPGVKVKPAKRTEQIAMSYTLPPLTGVHLEEAIPIKGTITSIVLHYPGGCNALVDVSVGHGERQLCPSGIGMVALDGATPVIPVSEKANIDDVVWVEMSNGDGANSHTITVIMTVEGD